MGSVWSPGVGLDKLIGTTLHGSFRSAKLNSSGAYLCHHAEGHGELRSLNAIIVELANKSHGEHRASPEVGRRGSLWRRGKETFP